MEAAMNELTDLLLNKPIGDVLLDILLFALFAMHFFFVLITIGTGILALYLFLETLLHNQRQYYRWDKFVLRTFMAHKSLAVVLGVGVLLLIQVGYTTQFFTGISLFAPWWMMIIPLLIISFISFDSLAHKIRVRHAQHLFFGFIALIALLIVPGIFVAVLVSAENPAEWSNIMNNGYRLSGELAIHWLFRYLHVIGAAIVFGSTFHYFYSSRDEKSKRYKLLKWIVGGLLFQVIIGILLYGYLPEPAGPNATIVLMFAVVTVLFFLWTIFRNLHKDTVIRWEKLLIMLLLVLIPMLWTRQILQDKSFDPMNKKLEAAAANYREKLGPYHETALKTYESDLGDVYNKGDVIYHNSCSFCHGKHGQGNGKEAGNLQIPPENLTAIRSSDDYLYQTLLDGVDGTGMPYFSYYDRKKLNSLMEYLDKNFGIRKKAYVISDLPQQSKQKADEIFKKTCSVCHGNDGSGTKLSAGFSPAPPDFRVFTVSPSYASQIIKNGYQGTMMQAHPTIDKDARTALAAKIITMFTNKPGHGKNKDSREQVATKLD